MYKTSARRTGGAVVGSSANTTTQAEYIAEQMIAGLNAGAHKLTTEEVNKRLKARITLRKF